MSKYIKIGVTMGSLIFRVRNRALKSVYTCKSEFKSDAYLNCMIITISLFI